MVEPAPPEPALCVACQGRLRDGARFCARCGHRVGDTPAVRPEVVSAWPDVRFALVVYAVLLAVQALGFILGALKVGLFENLLAGEVLLAVVALASAPGVGVELARLFRRAGFGPLGYLGIVGVSYPLGSRSRSSSARSPSTFTSATMISRPSARSAWAGTSSFSA